MRFVHDIHCSGAGDTTTWDVEGVGAVIVPFGFDGIG